MHGLFKLPVSREELPSLGKVTQDQPLLWSCVNDIWSSGTLADYNHHSVVPLTADIPAQLIYPSNTNLSFLGQVRSRNWDTTFHCKTKAIYYEPKEGMYPSTTGLKEAAISSPSLKVLVITTVSNFQPDEKRV